MTKRDNNQNLSTKWHMASKPGHGNNSVPASGGTQAGMVMKYRNVRRRQNKQNCMGVKRRGGLMNSNDNVKACKTCLRHVSTKPSNNNNNMYGEKHVKERK